ncbi:Nicotinamidase-related amidase [Pseudobutyrivibrio sp. 49]|uniref:cysteine hydrolase family protein n=1 Tax=Pseudobutyrivibrio sp. 49 TaxID=1855344 RepID=UPI00089166C9|nr:cysteine hydrolase family protein [Pseudobutyrivibrio sp. 49]SDI64936.1 Nicotinamidase-related amidase [Pseudobutyrivibrio sp. 49]
MVLLVIDIQKGITDNRLYNFDSFIRETKKVIDAARTKNVEIIYVQHDDGPGTGFSVGDEDYEIADQVAPSEHEKVYVKTINSAFGNEKLSQHLQEQEDKRLMIVGLQTNFCIDATVKSAFERGFKVIIPKGTNSTFDNDYMNGETTYRYYNEMMWPERFAQCVSVEEAIIMMERNYGTRDN